MISKLRKSSSYDDTNEKKEKLRNIGNRSISKIEILYMGIMFFLTNCLSSISVEAVSRSSLRNTTKSPAFNALFRRSYNLKIKIFVTNVIVGLTTTVMMKLGDKYNIPYLYLPWLVNTVKGMAFYEGPALFSLARVILPNVNFPAGSFMLTTLLLYAEELCIWKEAFTNFHRCWTRYHYRKNCPALRARKKLSVIYKKKLPCQDKNDTEINVAFEKLNDHENSLDLRDKSNGQISTDCAVKSIKSTIEGRQNFVRKRLLEVTG